MSVQGVGEENREKVWMRGFPPAPEMRVTHAQQLYGPYNRWSFQHIQQLNPTVSVWRGEGVVVPFEETPRELDGIRYQRRDGTEHTFGEMLELSYTDGIAVVHKGKLIYERYLNGMQPWTYHAWASASKSMTGTLVALLAYEGVLNLDEQITRYLPELERSGFAGATVRQAMNMTTAVKFNEDYPDPIGASRTMVENWQYSIAMGWLAKPAGYRGFETSYEVLAAMEPNGQHGERFTYLTANTDVLAWIVKRLLDKPLADIMHERIWSRLGVERDAHWVVGLTTEETSGSGLLTTLRDMTRFGQMMVQRGWFNGQQIVPVAVVEEIERGGRAPYRYQWWLSNNEQRAYYALGFGGQILYIDPHTELVVAKFSSYPTPVEGGEEFFHAFAALPVLARESGG